MRVGLKLHYTGGGGGYDDHTPPPPPGSNGGEGSDPCNIEISVLLQSLDLALARSLQLGQSLRVEIIMENQKERLCATSDGKVVGAIVSPISTQIIACIKQGNQYTATVDEINGNQYRVRIKKV